MIGDDIAAALPELRAQAESLLVDRCDIRRPDVTLLVDGREQAGAGELVHAGLPCRIQPTTSPDNTRQIVGGALAQIGNYRVRLPFAIVDVEPGMVLTITACRDPYLAGKRLIVSTVSGRGDGVWRQLVTVMETTSAPNAEEAVDG